MVFTSATLSTGGNFSYFKRRLGLDRIAPPDEIMIPSHFDFASQAILYVPKEMPSPDSAQFVGRAAAHIEELVALTKGRAFILFTSYRNMEEAYTILKDRLPFPVLLQGTKPRNELLQKFKEDVSSVLFATSSFWEGVDVMGEALSCVIVDKLPFASPSDPLLEARIEKIAAHGENPFLSYQVPQAIIALRQGFGRLIRSRNDRGVLSLLDRRVYSRHYGRLFLDSMPPCPVTNSMGEVKVFLQQLPAVGEQ
jgi:ATP-dependent DNA helicase DinG